MVNNAAVGIYKDVFVGHSGKGISNKILKMTMKTNILDLMSFCEEVLPALASDGKIINISSENG